MNFANVSFSSEVQYVLDIANSFIFTIGFIGLFFTIMQSLREKRRDREAARLTIEENRTRFAGDLYRDYLKIALDHPDLSAAKFDKANVLAADQYDTFISIMLYSFDEMISINPEGMIPVIDWQIEVHEPYIREILSQQSEGNFRGNYNKTLLDIIDKKLDELTSGRKAG